MLLHDSLIPLTVPLCFYWTHWYHWMYPYASTELIGTIDCTLIMLRLDSLVPLNVPLCFYWTHWYHWLYPYASTWLTGTIDCTLIMLLLAYIYTTCLYISSACICSTFFFIIIINNQPPAIWLKVRILFHFCWYTPFYISHALNVIYYLMILWIRHTKRANAPKQRMRTIPCHSSISVLIWLSCGFTLFVKSWPGHDLVRVPFRPRAPTHDTTKMAATSRWRVILTPNASEK